ncbi:MAG TPA: HypC/HybG/HupF family hydrogenase formation chaperone [Candidatus Bipolaricaulota bacterium]|nr:HypC/HybG/HupF family hydrogenase formation chaperone [Candidatus Bipolaricaulota bacterium]
MCLAIPGKIESMDKTSQTALVDFNGLKKRVNISLITPNPGDFVIVHAGFAIEIVDKNEADEIKKLRRE